MATIQLQVYSMYSVYRLVAYKKRNCRFKLAKLVVVIIIVDKEVHTRKYLQ